RFGAHQLREKVDKDCLLYVTWFGAGLRIIDISDPANPKERGYFIPKPGDGVKAPLTNDVYKDDRGLLFVTDNERGMDVIEFTGKARRTQPAVASACRLGCSGGRSRAGGRCPGCCCLACVQGHGDH